MKNLSIKKSIFIFLFLIGSIFFLSLFLKKTSPVYERVLGEKNAPIKIVEYLDYECPSCAGGSFYLKKLAEEYPQQIYLEMHYFPLNGHKHSFMAATYAECALKQNKFWLFHEKLLERQNYWRSLFYAQPAFEAMAKELGLNEKELDVCLRNHDVSDAIVEEKIKGQDQGINSTPTYFVNGKMLVGMEVLKKEVELLLPKKE